jgi:lipase
MSFRSAVAEPAALTLFVHGSLSSGKMWASISDSFDGTRRIMTPDLLGYGASPPWTGEGLQLRDEAQRLGRTFAGPVDIVAHSYGAAVALRLLCDAPHRVRTAVLIEPACFFLLPDLGPRAAADRCEIAALRNRIQERFEHGDLSAAASQFVDYWNGLGAFAAMPANTQQRLASRIGKVVADFDAVGSERMRLAALRKLQVPMLVVLGDRGPEGPRMIGEAITRAAPRASSIRIPGAGHMLPVTHGAELAGILSQWLGLGRPAPLSERPSVHLNGGCGVSGMRLVLAAGAATQRAFTRP